jgi:prepilin-type N-terminal cleavage/methylation domain-containing protein
MQASINRRKGFTLLELLTVIAAVAILASILLPALSHGKTCAKSAACKGNLRQFGIGLRLYVDDFERYPLYMNRSDRGVFPWEEELAAYFDVFKIIRCPGARPNQWWGDWYDYNSLGTDRSQLGWYTWNASIYPTSTLGLGMIGSVGVPVSESFVQVPSDMLAIGELMGFFTGEKLNHDCLGNNAVLCDGHVEACAPFQNSDAHHAKRLNNDNQPHKETWPPY